MRYNVYTGIQEQSFKIKRKLVAGVATAGFIVAGLAAPTFAAPTVSDNANPNACFGQARAEYSQGGPNNAAGASNGSVISTRKGDNPAINAQ